MTCSVIFVDDDPRVLRYLGQVARMSGYEVECFGVAEPALEHLAEHQPDVLVTDLRMPGVGGLELLARAAEASPDTQLVVLTGYGDLDNAVGALHRGVYDFLAKPVDAGRLLQALRNGCERRRLLIENRVMVRRLEESNRVKSEFLRGVSHEVRTPLGQILGFAELLAEAEGLRERERSMVAHIRSAGERLMAVFESMIELSILRSGEATLTTAPFSPTLQAIEVLEGFRTIAAHRGLVLDGPLSASGELVVADPEACRRIVQLLVDNAVTFVHDGGSVRVEVEVRSAPPPGVTDAALDLASSDTWLVVRVVDDGPGVPLEDQRRIFEMFEQVDGSTTRRHEGAGVGLALALALARIQGGTITLDSRPGRGSVFTLVVPSRESNGGRLLRVVSASA